MSKSWSSAWWKQIRNPRSKEELGKARKRIYTCEQNGKQRRHQYNETTGRCVHCSISRLEITEKLADLEKKIEAEYK